MNQQLYSLLASHENSPNTVWILRQNNVCHISNLLYNSLLLKINRQVKTAWLESYQKNNFVFYFFQKSY